MAEVTEQVDRYPADQPKWATKFLSSIGMGDIFFETHSKTFNGELSTYYSMTRHQNMDTGKHLTDEEISVAVQKQVTSLHPFAPPVTLRYTDEHAWEFTWATEAEHLMFKLKWA